MYKITIVKSRNLVESKMNGTFSPSMVLDYEAALREHFDDGTLQPGYMMLIDVSGAKIQTQQTICAFIQHVARMPKASRIAVVVGTSVIRMQVRRVLQQPYLRLFDARSEALPWLLSTDAIGLAA